MTGAPRKPATKLPHLRQQLQKNQIARGQTHLKALRLTFSKKKKNSSFPCQ
jgi:hypothetical protein